MLDNKESIKLPQNIVLKDREQLRVTGVTDVDSFDETVIVAYTDYGELTITGTGLHISSLDIEKGELSVDGKINSLSYLDQAPKSQGFFSKVFR